MPISAIIGGVTGIIVFFALAGVAKTIIRVMLPNKLLVVTGRSTKARSGKKFGFTVERGRTTVWPYINQVGSLDLGILPINVRVDGVNSANGISVGADATACVCIDDDDEAMLYSAVERLMGKSRDQIHEQIRQTLIGNFRGALNKATPLQAIGMEEETSEEKQQEYDQEFLQMLPQTTEEERVAAEEAGREARAQQLPATRTETSLVEGERAHFRHELLKDINSDLSHFGMKVVSVSLQNIWDGSNYIANLAQKTLARKRQEVEVQEKRLRAKAQQAESDSERRMSVAKSQAEERILKAQQKVEVFRRESEAKIRQACLEADNAIAEAQNRGEREVQEVTVDLQKLKNRSRVILEAEARQQAARIIAQGEREATAIREQARNQILRQKVDMLQQAGDVGKVILFIHQQLPHLFESYRRYAETLGIDSLVVMDEKKGLNGVVNRGPAAFVDFLNHLEQGLGVSVRDLLSYAAPADASQAPQGKEEQQ